MIATQRISARNLLRETFAAIGSVYIPLLMIASPSLILGLLNIFAKLGSAGIALNIIYCFLVVPLCSGAGILYNYRSLTGNKVTVESAFKQANRNVFQLILSYIMYALLVMAGLIVLIIPGYYVMFRLTFSLYGTAIDNSSALDSVSSSWELTKGRWWLVFRSGLLNFIVFLLPVTLVLLLIDPTAKSLAAHVASTVLGFLVGPLMSVYFVLLYLRLRETAATIK
jgi:hypothetical protein